MSKIIGLACMTVEALNKELANGAKFVVFPYCFYIVILIRFIEIIYIGIGNNSGLGAIAQIQPI